MRGVNNIVFAGNVGGRITFGTTSTGNDCCSFQIASEDKHNFVAWARINAYGGLVDICRKWVRKGYYVIVEGELMNRESGDGQKLTEIKASQIIVPVNKKYSNKNDDYENNDYENDDHERQEDDYGNWKND